MSRQLYKFSREINKKIESLYPLDNWHGLLALLLDYAVIAAMIIITLHFVWFYPVAIFVIGSRQRALATIQHEASHYALAKNKALNYLLGSVLSGHLIFQNFSTYVRSHVRRHHAFLGKENLDPDYQYHRNLGLYDRTTSSNARQIKQGIRFLASYWVYLLRHRMANFSRNDVTTHLNLWVNVILIGIFIYCGIFKYYLLFWLVPMLTTYLLVGWYIELAEHYPLAGENNLDLYMSRNRFGGFWENLFFSMHNENYHLVHHLKPRVPFWRLKQAHVILMEDPQYARLHQKTGGVFAKSKQITQWVSAAKLSQA